MADSQTKRCSKCGQSKPANEFRWRTCKTCIAIGNRVWKNHNRDRLRANKRRWKNANSEAENAKKRAWYTANQPAVRSLTKIKYLLNLEVERRRAREYARGHKDEHAVYFRRWAKANPDKILCYYHRKRARRKSLPDTWTTADAAQAIAYWGSACAVCGTPFDASAKRHFDHWIPMTNPDCPGTVASNMLPMCGTCNLSKYNTTPNIWLRREFSDRWEEIEQRIESYLKKQEIQHV